MATSIIQAEQTARRIERVLIRVYETLLKEITQDPAYPNYPTDLRFKYERQVYDATRKAIETVHIKALEYVGTTLGIETYLTTTDIDIIKKETDAAVEAFFTSLRKGAEIHQQVNVTREIDQILLMRLKGGSLLDPIAGILASFTRNAISFITKTFSSAIVSKTAQVGDLMRDVMIAKTGLPTSQQVQFFTQLDERVCPVCNGLHGTVYDVDDPTKPEIPDSTHYSCRCYYELVQ